jgi:beta-lactamase superfamily II metal-dependent hydrolase
MNDHVVTKGYELIFNRVGQGLFVEAVLSLSNGQSFNVVYDCGSTKKRHVSNAIDESVQRCSDPIDLLIISHFDKDHINGVLELLMKRTVRRIMLPYMSKTMRIASAVIKQNCYLTYEQERVIADPVFSLWQFSLAREVQPTIYFVREPGSDDFDTDSEGAAREYPEQVNIIDSGTDIFPNIVGNEKVASCIDFEIIPYNDKNQLGEELFEFKSRISVYIAKLLNKAKSDDDRRAAFYLLKSDYSTTFGESAYRKNLISLFAYISPLCSKDEKAIGLEAQQLGGTSKTEITIETEQVGVLLTGDGYLNNPTRVQGLREGLGKKELNLAVLQVSHHGAKSSWYRGLSSELNPSIAVFSSDPIKSYHHPHESVVKDFSNQVLLYSDTNRWGRVFLKV